MNLVYHSDIFLFFDDVNFIKKGWINRNRILLNGVEHMFTLPLVKASQNKKINEIVAVDKQEFLSDFKSKLVRSYSKSCFLDLTIDYVDTVFKSSDQHISSIAEESVKKFFEYIGIEKEFSRTSSLNLPMIEKRGVDRIMWIAKQNCCNTYCNLIGGVDLYDRDVFRKNQLELNFLRPLCTNYSHVSANAFLPGLSIIDLMVSLNLDDLKEKVLEFEIL